MKKVCLITSEESFLTNYGAALQGYALYTAIRQQGYEVDIQRYKGGILGDNRKIKKTFSLFKYSPFEIYMKSLFRVGKLLNRSKIKRQYQCFKSFQDKNMTFYPGQRKNWSTIQQDPPKADIYVCGSDQIWNPMFKGGYNDPGYFLAFASGKKIAYAPSFGVSDIPLTAQKDLAELLDSFDCISVREQQGKKIIEKYTPQKAKVVLDPTLLLKKQDWDSIKQLPGNLPPKYILCYRFGNSYSVDKTISKISQMTGLPIVELPLSGISYYNRKRNRCFEAGPAEFVGLISNASLVLTDSFHATVFSIIMKTPFITFLRSNDEKKSEGMNSRVTNLLKLLNLESRIFNPEDSSILNRLFDVNFADTDNELEKQRNLSKQWLIEALRGNDENE